MAPGSGRAGVTERCDACAPREAERKVESATTVLMQFFTEVLLYR